MAKDGPEAHDNAEEDVGDSGPEGETSGAGGGVGFSEAELAEEETEAANGEADAHETEASADPGEEGALGGEVDSGVLFGGLVGELAGGGHGGNCKGQRRPIAD